MKGPAPIAIEMVEKKSGAEQPEAAKPYVTPKPYIPRESLLQAIFGVFNSVGIRTFKSMRMPKVVTRLAARISIQRMYWRKSVDIVEATKPRTRKVLMNPSVEMLPPFNAYSGEVLDPIQ